MKDYFLLHYRRMNRTFFSLGVPIFLGYSLLVVGFIVASDFLFSKTIYSDFIYLVIALLLVSKLSKKRRNTFLSSYFLNYKKLRVVENTLVMIPFVMFLIYKQSYVVIIPLFILSGLISLIQFTSIFNRTIPSPFGRKPYEFSIGFRKTFYVFPIAYFVAYKAISVGNFNLGLFSMMLVFIIIMHYYTNPEDTYYTWIYNLSPEAFLKKKIKAAVVNSSILISPIVLFLSLSFYDQLPFLILFLLLCYLYLSLVILMKYSVYPNKMGIPEGVLLSLSMGFPPFLLILLPYLYNKSIKKLQRILND